MTTLPKSLMDNPSLDRWIAVRQDGLVQLKVGKVELGQGIATALAQIAADALEIDIQRIEITAGDTRECPDEWYTAGSFSVQVSGAAVRSVAVQTRDLLLAAAARRLDCPATELVVDDGMVRHGRDAKKQTTYWALLDAVDLRVPVTGNPSLSPAATRRYIGESVPRIDLPAKVTGAGFIHDIEFPGMLHGRVLRPPALDAELDARSVIAGDAQIVALVQDGNFLGLCAEDEFTAHRAAERLSRRLSWRLSGDGRPAPVGDALTGCPARTTILQDADEPDLPGKKQWARFTRPYLAHASIGTSCAIAQFSPEGDRVTVWTHSQGVYPLRTQLARVIGLATDAVDVVHAHGAGCYGHNGADDVALDAALLARAVPGRPVRVLWSREQELACSPASSAMAVEIEATLDAKNRVAQWSLQLWSGPHGQRPGWNGDVNLLAAQHLATPFPSRPAEADIAPALGGGGDRNAIALYAFPNHSVRYHFLPDLPLRLSSLRTLGGFANVFAIESFMDELAEAAGVDPLAFRLAHLDDPRAAAVLRTASEMAAAEPQAENGARGIGFARYKNSAAYCAVVAEIVLADEVCVRRVWCAVDAGLAINPDGLCNQIEGGIVQAASWTLKEALPISAHGVAARSWDDYPILRFDEVPEVTVTIVPRLDDPPLGVGEAAHGPAAGAIANAVARASGVRVRDLPITRERIVAAMHA